MNRLGMVIDLARSSVKTQLKVLDISKAPCIFSSTAMDTPSPQKGNIKDAVIEKIVSTG